MLSAEKITVRFGIKRFNGAALQRSDGGNFGMPDPTLSRSVATIPRLESAWSFALDAFGPEVCGEMITVPRRANTAQGPVTAIAIAADSPIESVDLHISGSTSHVYRVAPGAPFVGDLDDGDKILVVPNRPTPALLTSNFATAAVTEAQMLEESNWWDAPPASTDGVVIVPVPARLVLFRGPTGPAAAAALSRRARYTASAIWQVRDRGGAVPTEPTFTVLVDGRRRFRVEAGAWNGIAAGASLEIRGVIGHTSMIAAGLSTQLDLPGFDELLAATVLDATAFAESLPTIYDYMGNPYYAVECMITSGTIGDAGYVTVHAWDE